MTIPLSKFFRLPKEPAPAQLQEVLRPYGFSHPKKVWKLFSPFARDLSVKTDWVELVPLLLESLRQSPDPDRAAVYFSSFIEQAFHRAFLFQYLVRKPQARNLLCWIFGGAPALAMVLIRHPNWLYWLTEEDALNTRFQAERFRREVQEELQGLDDLSRIWVVLARFHQREMLRLGAVDLLGLADVPEITRELSDVADVLMDEALKSLSADRQRKGNFAPAGFSFCVLGMGKLGGRELNYSSDIDLLFLYEGKDAGVEEQRKAHVYYNRLAEELVQGFSQKTEEGPLYRVDLRLRPEGTGDLAYGPAAYLEYYETRSDLWERQAFLKARPCAGDLSAGVRFLKEMEPLLFNREVSLQAPQAIRDLMKLIEKKMKARELSTRQVKLGRGGIREIEFLVQMLQLVHGAQKPSIRSANTLEALERLEEERLLLAADAKFLSEAYVFLRKVEHRLQMVHQLQTHTLPKTGPELKALARMLNYQDRIGGKAERFFMEDYTRITRRVREIYEERFHLRKQREPTAEIFQMLLEKDAEKVQEALKGSFFSDPAQAAQNLLLWFLRLHRTAGAKGETLAMKFIPQLWKGLARVAHPDRALSNLERFFRNASLPDFYLRYLLDEPRALSLLLDLFSDSVFLSETLLADAGNLEVMLRCFNDPSPVSIQEHLEGLEERWRSFDDWEDRLNVLREFRNAQVLRIGTLDLLGRMELWDVFAELSRLAYAVVRGALRIAAERLNMPRADTGDPVGFWIAAAGKLGGRELNYGSDLDVLFVYADEAEARAGGYARFLDLARLVIEALSAPTAKGKAYEVDARLRPMGKEAPLVHSLNAYGQYFRKAAEPWERLAYTRVQFLAGDHEGGFRFSKMIGEFVYGRGLTRKEYETVLEVRRRMEEKSEEDPEGEFKVAPGGIADVEFFVQLMQLAFGHAHPEICVPHTPTALSLLGERSFLPAEVVEKLSKAYRFYRLVESRLRMVEERSVSRLPSEKEALTRLAGRLRRGKRKICADEVFAEVVRRKREVRAIFNNLGDYLLFE